MSAVARTIEEETGTICVTMAANLTQAHAANMTGTSLTADGGWTKAIA